MASTSLQVAGLASNFDWKSFVDSIMELERQPINRLESEKTQNSTKVNVLNSLGGRLTALGAAADGLKLEGLFSRRAATLSTTNSTWKASASAGTAIGTYKVAVSQLATAASLAGSGNVGAALNPSGNDVSGLTLANLPVAQAVTAGTFSVNGRQVTVALTDSLQDVFDAISTATGGEVTASYDSATDRVSLTSSSGSLMLGAANDTSNFLRALKLGNNGTDTVTSSAGLGTIKTAAPLVSANLGTPVTGVDAEGDGTFSINGVEIAYNVNTDSLAAVIKRINASGAGVTASYDTLNDRMVLSNSTTGDLGISVSEAAGGLLGALGLTSGTTFTRGKNAEFTINDGATFTSASNTFDASSHGIEGFSITATAQETQTITVAANTSAMREKIEAFISAFNDVQSFLESQTKITTDSRGKVTAAPLASNREIQEWGRSLRSFAFNAVSGLSGGISRLDDIGIDFSSTSGTLEIKDTAKLDRVLTEKGSDVEEFFSTPDTGFVPRISSYLTRLGDQNSTQQTNLNKANTRIDDQIAAIERQLEQRRLLMESAFIQMETAQSRISQQQSAINSLAALASAPKK